MTRTIPFRCVFSESDLFHQAHTRIHAKVAGVVDQFRRMGLSEEAARLMATKGEDPTKLSSAEAFELAKKYVEEKAADAQANAKQHSHEEEANPFERNPNNFVGQQNSPRTDLLNIAFQDVTLDQR